MALMAFPLLHEEVVLLELYIFSPLSPFSTLKAAWQRNSPRFVPKNHLPHTHNPQLVPSQNSKHEAAILQQGDGLTIAANRLESSINAQINAGPIRPQQFMGNSSPTQTLPPNRDLELSPVEIGDWKCFVTGRNQISDEIVNEDVLSQSQFENNGARPNYTHIAALLKENIVPAPTPCQQPVDELPDGKDKAIEPTPFDQCQPVPKSSNLSHSGILSTASLSNDQLARQNVIVSHEQARIATTASDVLTNNVNIPTMPQLTRRPTPSTFPKISTNFDKMHTAHHKKQGTYHHMNTHILTSSLKETPSQAQNHSQSPASAPADTQPTATAPSNKPKQPNIFSSQNNQPQNIKTATPSLPSDNNNQPIKIPSYPTPPPPTVTQSLATELRARQAAELAHNRVHRSQNNYQVGPACSHLHSKGLHDHPCKQVPVYNCRQVSKHNAKNGED
uniref:Uncharacterized protein n=1 Tax=Nicotiana tabacum TaxID=4097 RepID=A0A1S3YDB0_TOBAC|nr:PREDICTED: uncharacterized protein LOC107774970 [Nicotiana tabacum]